MSTQMEWSDLSVEERRKLLDEALVDAVAIVGGTHVVPDNSPSNARTRAYDAEAVDTLALAGTPRLARL